MLFISYEFLGFLVVLFIFYYALPSRAQWPLLLAASYLFYGCADPSYLLYILATTGTTFTPASSHMGIKREGFPAPVVTTGTRSWATSLATSSA